MPSTHPVRAAHVDPVEPEMLVSSPDADRFDLMVADPPPVLTETTRVLVVDDHRTFAELLSGALDAEPDLQCVGHAQNAREAFGAVARLRPHVVLMDVRLPDRDGISTAASSSVTTPT